jgi:Uma2 family endonuclease
MIEKMVGRSRPLATPIEGSSLMSTPVVPANPRSAWPDHKQLPETDGTFVENFQELPQTVLLDGAITPYLHERYPDGQFLLGHDNGIYWWHTDPPLSGCKSPDWYFIRGVAPTLAGEFRRSYVLWHEEVPPLIVLEYVSGDGSVERDRTPRTGKFWVYEQGIRAQYYGIYEVDPGQIEMHHLVNERYERMQPNERDHYLIPELGLELGLWQGEFYGVDAPWMRWFDEEGRMLPSWHEQAEIENQRAERERQKAAKERQRAKEERQRAEQEHQRAEQEHQRAESEHREVERLKERLRQLGVDPNKVGP